MKTKLRIGSVLALAVAFGFGGWWLRSRGERRAENQANATAAASANAIEKSPAAATGVPGQFKFCQHADEAPAWTVAYGKEFWRQREPRAAGNIALNEVVDRVSHAFTADPATRYPSLRAKNYAASFSGNGLRFSPYVPPGSGHGVTLATTAEAGSAFHNNPDAMENVEYEQQVFAANAAAQTTPRASDQPRPSESQRRASLLMPQPDPQTEVTFHTVAIRQDGQPLYLAEQTSPAGTVVGNTVQSLLGSAIGLIEHYEASANGVHVTWVLSQKPPIHKPLTVETELTGLTFAGRSTTGLHFADASGVARVGVSDVTAIDSLGKSWPLQLQANGALLSVTVPENILAQAAFPLAIDPTIFPEFGMDTPVAARAPADQQKPAVAANGGTFLVVWEDSRNFATTEVDIFGARVSAAGSLLDPGGISITTVGGTAPAVAALGSGFLVVWEDSRNATTNGVDIYGTRVTSAGTITDPAGIPISRAASDQLAPAVASAGPNALVVWQDSRNVASAIDIYGAIVQNNGTVSDPAGIPITTDSGPQFSPAVAFNGNRYLVAWSDFNGTAVALSGARVTTAGAVSDSPAISIDPSGTDHLQPSVAAVGTMFLVVWEDYRNAGVTFIDILGKRVDDAGNVLDRSPFPIGNAFSDRFAPAAVGGKDFLVVWQDGRDLGTSGNDIYAARVGTDGVVINANGIPVSTALNDQTSPAIAFNGTDYFIAWTDARNSATSGLDIYGTLLSTGGSVGSPNGTLLSSGASGEQHPTVAANGANYLVVWEDSRNADVSGIDLYGVRVSTNGAPLDLNAIPISTAAGDQLAPAATALGFSPGGTDYFVVWQDQRNTATTGADIYGARISTGGSVLDAGGIPVSRGADDQLAPAIASSGAGYLAVWQDARNLANEGLDIFGARISSSGVVTDINGLAISTAPGNQVSPAVAFAGGTYLVVWTDARNLGTTDNDIYGARVSTAGVVSETGGLPISRAAGDELAPAVAPSAADFLVVWQDARNLGSTDYDIYGARVTSGGVVSDVSGFAIGVAANAQSLPAVAANGTNLLVVWQDARGSGLDVYGARVVGASVLDPLGLAINTGVLGQQLPALASGSARAFLVVNQAVRNGADRIVGNILWIDDAPFITSITRAGGSATLIWTSISGRTYRVQYRANITDPSWLDLSGDVLATTSTATKTDSTIGTALTRFYRVILLP